jgi:hypothetical protein
VATQTTTVIQTDTTNSNLAIVPNGTGALVASIPDGTATGGNARGQYSVDLQILRGANTQVTSGNYAVISGGQNNTATGGQSFIGGGFQNSTTDSLATTVGGRQNTAGYASFMGGGQSNNASAFWGVCVGGQRNTSIGYGFVGGGLDNSITTGGYSNIVGGELNVVNTGAGTNAYSVISGGRSNSITSAYSTISGGQTNIASTNTHATVVGGASNTSSGQYSVTGGNLNIASALGTTVFGQSNNATVRWAFAVGMQNNNGGGDAAATIGYQNTISINALSSMALGYGHTINGAYSTGLGADTLTYLYGQVSSAASLFANDGDAQQSLLTARRSAILTTGGTTTLSLDGTGTTNLIIPNGTNRMWNVTIKFVAVVTTITGTATGVTVGDTKSQNIEIGFKKVGGVSSLVGSGVYSIPQEDASMGSASLIPTAGASQELALTFTAPTFTGGGSVTCRVVAKVELVEVAY